MADSLDHDIVQAVRPVELVTVANPQRQGGDRILASGEKWVSPDGKTMSLTVDGTEEVYVSDRTGP